MPGGCDIFDPFQAQDAHAAIGLTPGDVYWRTREPVQVNGECKYLVAACTPCCDVRGTILGSHEFGGTMLDAAPDVDTGDVVLSRRALPCVPCQVHPDGLSLCWPPWMRVEFPRTTLALDYDGSMHTVHRARVHGHGLLGIPFSITGAHSFNTQLWCVTGAGAVGVTRGGYNDVPYSEYHYANARTLDDTITFTLPHNTRRWVPSPFYFWGLTELRFHAGVIESDGAVFPQPRVKFRHAYTLADIVSGDNNQVNLAGAGLLVQNAWSEESAFGVRIFASKSATQLPIAATTEGEPVLAAWEVPVWSAAEYERADFRIELL